MIRTDRRVLARVLAILLLITVVFASVPINAFANNEILLGTVTAITPAVIGGTPEDVTVTISEATLQWHPADTSIGRNQDGWWVGMHVAAPEDCSEDATYKISNTLDDSDVKNGLVKDNTDGQYWLRVTPEMLQELIYNGKSRSSVYEFDWDANGECEQKVTFSVVPSGKIVLMKDVEGENIQVYPTAALKGTVTSLNGGIVETDEEGNVTVTIKEATLKWFAADTGVGRNEDGWWVGIHVAAPEGYSEYATYMTKTNPANDTGEVKLVKNNADGQFWFRVTPESLQKFISENRNITMTYLFDWNADSVREQTVTFSVVPSDKIVLEKDENDETTQAFPSKPLYGEVSSYSVGTVDATKQENVIVTVDEATIQKVAADENIGRAEGWWIGIHVNSPEGYSEEYATYFTKTNSENDPGTREFVKNNKDGQLWISVTPDSISEKRDLTRVYEFDWNADGVYEQKVTFTVVPSDKIVLLEGDKQHYPYPTVTVESVGNGSVTLNEKVDTSISVKCYDVVVIALKAEDGYQINTLSIGGENIADASGKTEFNKDVTITKDTKVDVTFIRVWTVNFVVDEKGNVTYTVDGDDVGGKLENIIIKDGSKVQFTATAKENFYHVGTITVGEEDIFTGNDNNDNEITKEITIKEDTTIKVMFALDTYIVTATTDGNGTVKWADTQTADTVITHGLNAKLYIVPNVGFAIESVTVVNDALDVKIDDKGFYVELTNVTEAKTVEVKFAQPEVVNPGDEITKKLDNDYYSITYEGVKEAYMDGDTVVIVLRNKGSATIVPKAPYTEIKINDDDKDATKDYKTSIVVSETTLIKGVYVKSGIVADDIKNIAVNVRIVIDKAAPELADIAQQDPEWTKDKVIVSGTATDLGGSGLKYVVWSKGTTLKDDQILAETTNRTDIVDGAYSFTLEDEQKATYYVYAVDYAENISAVKDVVVCIDKTAPEVIHFDIPKTETINTALHFLTFGIFGKGNSDVTVVVTANDSFEGLPSSGVESITLKLGDKTVGERVAVESDNKATFEFTISEDDLGQDGKLKVDLTAIAYDNAGNNSGEIAMTKGNSSLEEGQDIFLIESNASQITIEPVIPESGYYKAEDGKEWFAQDIKFNIKVTDADSGIRNAIVKINDTEVDKVIYNSVEDKADQWVDYISFDPEKITTASANIGDYSEYKVTVVVTDNAGNETTNSYTVYKDTTAPEVTYFEIPKNDPINKTLHFLTFGIFGNGDSSVKVIVTANDVIALPEGGVTPSSGVKEITLYLGDDVFDTKKVDENNQATFVIDFDENLTEVKLSAVACDNVGNIGEKIAMTKENSSIEDGQDIFLIESEKPIISDIKVEGFENVKNHDSIYSGDAKISFKAYDAKSGLYSVAVKVNGENPVDIAVGDDTYQGVVYYADKQMKDEQTYTFSTQGLAAKSNGAYEFTITVTDCANNVTTKEVTVYKDQTAPIISGFEFKYQDKDGSWQEIKNEAEAEGVITFGNYGFYANKKIEVTINAEDKNSSNEASTGVSKIICCAVGAEEPIWHEFDGQSGSFEIDENFKGQIYAYAVDNVGNNSVDGDKFYDNYVPSGTTTLVTEGDYKGFVHPNGAILESPSKHEQSSSIEIEAHTPVAGTQNNSFTFNYTGEGVLDREKAYEDDTQNVPLYNTETVVFDVTVKDDYSGIRFIELEVINGEVVGTSKIEILNNGKIKQRSSGWTITNEEGTNLVNEAKSTVTVKGNSNDMVLVVKLTDRAGNVSYDYYVFGIDVTAPTIHVEYDNNEVSDDDNTNFFRTDRVATITITERNFLSQNVVVTITKDGVPASLVDFTDANKWDKSDGATPDETKYVAKVTYAADGDYTFDIKFTDNASNAVDWEPKSVADDNFTIDKTDPTVSVSYDNNSSKNGNYYDAQRVATIVVTEHNFDPSRVDLSAMTATSEVDGVSVVVPNISGWVTNGDVHTTTITYSADAKYTFDVVVKDMAGRFELQDNSEVFYVDTTNPVISITGVTDSSANNDKGNIGFEITTSDIHFDVFETKITGLVMVDGQFKTINITSGVLADIENGKKLTVANIEQDGIYGIVCTVVDKAGNAFSEVILKDKNGNDYVESRGSGSTLITFSVNRYGSTFALDKYTENLVKLYYVQNVTDNVIITEINADPIPEHTVTLNGTVLTENVDYTVLLDNNGGSWYKYSYILNRTLFSEQGEYNVIVSSKDKATNEAFSDIKNATIKFVVDRTAPVITVAGLKNDGRYQVEKQVVTLVPSDDGGLLKTLIVRTVDEDGNVINELVNLSGDALLDALATGNITFELAEGLYQNVQIICEDQAGNITGSKANEIYRNVSISSNIFMIFWANEPLRWGSIAGVILLTAAIVFFIVHKKRKKAK